MNYMVRVSILFLVITTFCFAKQYSLSGSKTAKYQTLKEKQKFFKSIGCEYSNIMEIYFPDFGKIDPRQTSYYQSYASIIDALSKKYHDQVVAHALAPMYLKWVSSVVGYGAFAAENIAKDEFIGVYTGQLRRVFGRDDKIPEDLDYAWYYTVDDPDGKHRLIVDGKYHGNELRFINHADNPNTKRIDVLINGRFYVCYVACKPIPKDTQLTVSYGDGYWTSRNLDPEQCK